MARKGVCIRITLIFETPPSIAAAGAFGSMADRVMERNGKGQFVIPGSQVKGKLRNVCEQLLRSLERATVCDSPRAETMCPNRPGTDAPCPICQLFGSPSLPSPLLFQDLVWPQDEEALLEPPAASLRVMIGMNRRRSTVAEQRLFLVETVPYSSTLRFANNRAIMGTLETEAQVKLLLAGLRLIPAWGGMKSRGLGWITQVEASATLDGKPVEATGWEEVTRRWNG